MSLTNPNNVVTERRLSEFYGQIYPYLGGMPEILANKFSKSDLYSTNEKMVGQWIDGKPLYQKSLPAYTLSGITDKTSKTFNIDAGLTGSTIDTVWIDAAFVVNTSSGYVTMLNQSWGNGVYDLFATLHKTSANVTVGLSANRSTYNNTQVYITIQYTKTGDTIVPIGNDTDYSTEEKIVGTWIDGKPIYQKVFNCGNNITNGEMFDLQLDNPETLRIECFGVAGASTMPLPQTEAGSVFSWYYSASISRLVFTKNDNSWSTFTIYAIIQYTKTTD